MSGIDFLITILLIVVCVSFLKGLFGGYDE